MEKPFETTFIFDTHTHTLLKKITHEKYMKTPNYWHSYAFNGRFIAWTHPSDSVSPSGLSSPLGRQESVAFSPRSRPSGNLSTLWWTAAFLWRPGLFGSTQRRRGRRGDEQLLHYSQKFYSHESPPHGFVTKTDFKCITLYCVLGPNTHKWFKELVESEFTFLSIC